ncbi:MAG: hypothetical protein WA784_03695, partial [Albidovulum sp.]
QYTALLPVIANLNDALSDGENLPVELFDACASASRMTVSMARVGECPQPEKDPLVQDFLIRIREAGADILANDPKAQEMVARRNDILGNEALIDGGATIRTLAAQIAAISEGRLAESLQDDAEVATDSAADPEARKVSSYRLSGRLVRSWKTIISVGAGIGRLVVNAKNVLEALAAIQASPLFQQAVSILWRALGL